jgi:quercetin dioxygenase-like cupin family protein
VAAKLLKGKYAAFDGSATVRNILASEGYDIFAWSDGPGAYYSKHSHPHDEYIVVDIGQITFLIDAQPFQLESGDALVLPAGTVHEAENRSTKPVSYYICTRK